MWQYPYLYIETSTVVMDPMRAVSLCDKCVVYTEGSWFKIHPAIRHFLI
jgi:hypothetical protein